MFVLRHTLSRSLAQFRLAPNALVTSSRWSSGNADQKSDSAKQAANEKQAADDKQANDEGKKAKKPEHPNPEYQRSLQQQEELFEEFKQSTADMALVEKQDAFLDMLYRFKNQNLKNQRFGDCEFILGCLKILKPLDLHKELEIYKQLMSVFPKEKMKTTNYYQQMLQHYPKHQETAMLLLEEMGMNGIFPDKEMRIIVRDIFGGLSDVHRKILSMNYWNSKLLRKSPFPIPDRPVKDPFELAKLALKKMCCHHDPSTKIQKYDSSIASTGVEPNEWILTAQSPHQKELIKRLDEIVYVEGPFTCFVQHERSVKYFVLKTNVPNMFEFKDETQKLDVSRLKISTFGRKEVVDLLESKLKLHHQEDGHILATCITERSSEASLLAWIRILCKLNENLDKLQVVFKIDYDQEPKGLWNRGNLATGQEDKRGHEDSSKEDFQEHASTFK